MTDSIVMCKLCKTPLTTEDQFIGHMIHSHEFRLEDAAYAWHMSSLLPTKPMLVGE